MKYEIWYMKPEWFRDGICHALPKITTLSETHTLLMSGVEFDDMDEAYFYFQAEVWSSKGEARPLISELGLKHTSMSVGDVLVTETGDYYVVASFGFTKLEA